MSIHSTLDYSMFKSIPGNRAIKEKHVLNLMQSIKNKDLLQNRPILVNDDLAVIDGQHRLEAAKRLGIPIYYCIDSKAGYKEIVDLNTSQANWEVINYFDMYLAQGCSEYLKLNEFMRMNGITLYDAIQVFLLFQSRSRLFYENFARGKFIFSIDPNDFSFFLLKMQEAKELILTNKINKINNESYLKTRSFTSAFLRFCHRYKEKIRWDIFFEHIIRNIDFIGPRANQTGYQEMFVKIYNYRLKDRLL